MKSVENWKARIGFFVTALLASIYSFAQDQPVSTGTGNVSVTHSETTMWYTNPWVWIVGVAVFILLFAAIVRGGSRTDA